MGSALQTRLRRIEHMICSTRVVEPCPECSHTPGAPPTLARSVTFAGDPGADETPEYCPRCGTLLVLRLEFDKLG